MNLIRKGVVVEDDYPSVADDAPIPEGGKALISWDRFKTELVHSGISPLLGVRLPNNIGIEAIWQDLEPVSLIALEFPSFADGRAYSQARLLRDRYRFSGELRAVGHAVVLDQIQGLYRCGFDSFELRDDQDVSDCAAALSLLPPPYQRAIDLTIPVIELRRQTSPVRSSSQS